MKTKKDLFEYLELQDKLHSTFDESVDKYDARMKNEVSIFNNVHGTDFDSFDCFHDYLEWQEEKYAA